MKTLNSYSRKFSARLLVILLVLSAAASCSKDEDDPLNPGGGNNNGSNTVKIQNFAFSPATLTVTAGTTVTWKNFDDVAHTATSDNGVFDSGSLAKDETYTYTFDEAGTFNYHCTPHPQMTAKVVVN